MDMVEKKRNKECLDEDRLFWKVAAVFRAHASCSFFRDDDEGGGGWRFGSEVS